MPKQSSKRSSKVRRAQNCSYFLSGGCLPPVFETILCPRRWPAPPPPQSTSLRRVPGSESYDWLAWVYPPLGKMGKRGESGRAEPSRAESSRFEVTRTPSCNGPSLELSWIGIPIGTTYSNIFSTFRRMTSLPNDLSSHRPLYTGVNRCTPVYRGLWLSRYLRIYFYCVKHGRYLTIVYIPNSHHWSKTAV